MKRLRHLLITSSVLVLSSVYATSTYAKIQCPEAPKQFSKTVTVETEGKASTLGKLGTAELKNKTEVLAKDLLEKVPNQDRVFLGQTLISVYCQMLDQSTQLSDKEKLDRMDIVTKQVAAISTQTSSSPATTKPSKKSAAGRREIPSGNIHLETHGESSPAIGSAGGDVTITSPGARSPSRISEQETRTGKPSPKKSGPDQEKPPPRIQQETHGPSSPAIGHAGGNVTITSPHPGEPETPSEPKTDK